MTANGEWHEQEAFIRTIAAAPDDDAPRLVYADWLEERGDEARAEFIRVQCRLARTPPSDPALPALRLRERSLLQIHEKSWVQHLMDLCLGVTFRRGFPWEVVVNAGTFVRRGAELVDAAPTAKRLRLQGVAQHVTAVAASPALRAFTGLAVRRPHVPTEALADLIASPHLGHLTELDLSNNWLTAHDIAFALGHRYPDRVERLLLVGCPVGVAGVRRVLAKGAFPALKHLHITLGHGHESTRFDSFDDLGAVPGLDRLETFELQLWPSQPLNVGRLAASAALPAVTHLGAAHQTHPVEELVHLCSSTRAAKLRQLDLSFTNVADPAVLSALLGGAIFGGVESLLLSRVRLGEAGARAVAHSPAFANLVALDLSLNGLGDAAARELASAPGPTRLTTLDLIYNRMGSAGREALDGRFGAGVCLFDR